MDYLYLNHRITENVHINKGFNKFLSSCFLSHVFNHGHFLMNFIIWLLGVEFRKSKAPSSLSFSAKIGKLPNCVMPSAFVCVKKVFSQLFF